jgi:hypothetical protein
VEVINRGEILIFRVVPFVLLETSPDIVAQQILLIEFDIFKQLQPCEFLEMRWQKDKALAPALTKLSNFSNMVNNYCHA